MVKQKHVYIKNIFFERNIETGDLEVRVGSNHGDFILRDDVLDMTIIYSVLDYLKGKATDVITRWAAEQAQLELEKTSEDRAREALGLETNGG
jgi:translation initiation factor IF-3